MNLQESERTQTFYFTASTDVVSGGFFKHHGTLEGARRRAEAYAVQRFARDPHGWGPTITIVDAETGHQLIQEQL